MHEFWCLTYSVHCYVKIFFYFSFIFSSTLLLLCGLNWLPLCGIKLDTLQKRNREPFYPLHVVSCHIVKRHRGHHHHQQGVFVIEFQGILECKWGSRIGSWGPIPKGFLLSGPSYIFVGGPPSPWTPMVFVSIATRFREKD